MTSTSGADGATDSMDSAANFFESMMDSAEGRTPRSAPQKDQVEDAESDELEADLDDEAEDDDEAAEHGDEDDEEDESESDDDDVLDETELKRKVPVRDADGNVTYKTVEELLKDGLRQSDYTRKTQQLADERRQLEAKAQELAQVQQERAYYQQVLEAQQRQLVEQYQPLTDAQWKHLRDNDPLEYTIRKQDLIDRREAYNQAEAQKQYLSQKMAHEQQQAHQSTLSNEYGKLFETHPEWKNPKVWTKVKSDILEYGKTLGYSEQDLQSATDSRAVLALYNGMMADKVRNAKPSRNIDPKAPKPMSATAATVQKPRVKAELAKSQQRLKKSGSVEDAADIFTKLGLV